MSSGRRTATTLVRVPRQLAQLTLLGGEVPHPPKLHHRPLSPAAAVALSELRRLGPRRPVELGRAVHKTSGCVKEGARFNKWRGSRSQACCPYAADHGYAALKQLAERRLARRRDDGYWEALPD